MAHINVNLDADNDIPQSGDEIHPDGPMRVRVHSYEIKTKNDNSGQYISWRVDPSQEGVTLKRPIFFNTSLGKGKLKGTIALLSALQVPYEINADKTLLSFDPDEAIGQEFIGNLGNETYDGKAKNTMNFPYQKVK